MKITKHGRVIIDMVSHNVSSTGYCVDAEGGTMQDFHLQVIQEARAIIDAEILRCKFEEKKALRGVSR